MNSVIPDAFVYISSTPYNIVGIQYRQRICLKTSVSLFSSTSVGNFFSPAPLQIFSYLHSRFVYKVLLFLSDINQNFILPTNFNNVLIFHYIDVWVG
jgi:hypothetical protein